MRKLLLAVAMGAGLLFGQPNELNLRQDPPPAIQSERVTATYTGTAGATTYYYWIVTRYPIGFTVPTAPVIVARAASSLGGGNSVALSWTAMAGASSYDVLRTSTPAAPSSCTCAVTLATTSTTLTDSGGGLSAWPPAGLHAAGSATMVLQINNRDGGAPYIEMAVQNAQRALNYQLGLLKDGPVPGYVPSGFIQTYANQYGRLACVDGNGADCLNSVFNVLDFGAVCDGTTNDTTAIQSAINAAQSSSAKSKRVIFPAGQCATDPLTISGNSISIVGQGNTHDQTSLMGTVLKKLSNGTGLYITGGSVSVSSLTVNGNSTTGYGIQVSGPNCNLADVSVVNAEVGIRIGNDATSGYNANQWRLYNVTARNNTSHGLHISDNTSSGVSANANAGLANGVFLYGNGGSGMLVEQAFANNFNGINAESNSAYGILISGSYAQNNALWSSHAEGNSLGQIHFATGSANNLAMTADNNDLTDSGTNSIIRATGGVSQIIGTTRSILVSQSASASGSWINRRQLTWVIGLEGDTPGRYLYNTVASANNRLWTEVVSGATLSYRITSDDLNTETNWLRVARTDATSATSYFDAGNVHITNGALVPIRIDWAASSLGACDSGSRGRQQFVAGGAGVADRFVVCGKSSLDAYAWYDIAAIP